MAEPTRDHPPHFATTDLSPAADTHSIDAPTGGPGGSPSPDAAPHAPPGYKLLEEVGRGGMGVVYRARDAALNRSVAVKFLLGRYPADGPTARRFVEEAQITGQLQHPGIPPVHEVGALPDGRPFLVMKLIKGRTLEDLLADRAAPGADRGRFLAIFEQVCQAVGYAHAHKVIHRDLKPSNVMVGAFGEVQVMDWGLAKSLVNAQPATATTASTADTVGTEIRSLRDQQAATQAGSILGTPAFIPPEQAGGEIAKIDARSDVFGLGAVLCVILTGKPPYVSTDSESVRLMAIRGQLADALSRLDGCGAEPELVALCKRCLSVEQDQRPKDGNAVAAAVAGLRAASEERARQAELDRVRATEQRKRARVQLALAASVLVMVVGGGAVAWWQYSQTAERKAKADRDEIARVAARDRDEADRRATEAGLKGERDAEARNKAAQARQGVKAGLTLATDLRKQYKFKQADAALAQAAALAKGGAPELLAEVEQARRDLAFVVKLDDIRFRKWAWIADGGTKGKGDFNTRIASPEYRKAFADRGLDLEALDTTEAARRIAASAVKAELVAAADDWALWESDEALRNRLLEVARRADPGPWTDRLRDPAVRSDKAAVAKFAADANTVTTSSAALSVLATLMRRSGLDPSPLLSAARAKHPTDFELAFALGQWHTHSKDGREIGPYEAARALRPENPVVWNNLGAALADKGDVDGAIAAYRGAVKHDPKYATAHTNLGVALKDNGDANGAIAAYKEAIKHDPKYALAHYNLGVALKDNGDANGAIAAFKEAVKYDPKLAWAHNNLGAALSDNGDANGAIAAYKEAIKHDPKLAPAHYNLGFALNGKGDVDGAVAAYKEAIRLDPKEATAHTNLGVIYAEQKKYAEAIACARAAIEADPKFSNAHALLGLALQQVGDAAGARAALTEAAWLDKRWASKLAKLPPIPVAPPPREVKR